MTQKLILTRQQAKLLEEGLCERGELEIHVPQKPKPPYWTDSQRVGTFTVTRYDAPKHSDKDEFVRLGFRFAQYFKLRMKKRLFTATE